MTIFSGEIIKILEFSGILNKKKNKSTSEGQKSGYYPHLLLKTLNARRQWNNVLRERKNITLSQMIIQR